MPDLRTQALVRNAAHRSDVLAVRIQGQRDFRCIHGGCSALETMRRTHPSRIWQRKEPTSSN